MTHAQVVAALRAPDLSGDVYPAVPFARAIIAIAMGEVPKRPTYPAPMGGHNAEGSPYRSGQIPARSAARSDTGAGHGYGQNYCDRPLWETCAWVDQLARPCLRHGGKV